MSDQPFALYPQNRDSLKSAKSQPYLPPIARWRLWLPIGFLIAAALVGGYWYFGIQELARDGVHIDAQVTDRQEQLRQIRGDTYWLTYRFMAYGEDYEAEKIVPSDVYQSVTVGDTISVRYLPEQPEINNVEANLSDPLRDQLLVFGLAVLTVACGYGLIDVYNKQQARARLLRYGRIVRGTITAAQVVDRGVHRPQAPVLEFRYRFTSPASGAKLVAGETSSLPDHLSHPPQPGAAISILYVDDQHFAVL